MDDKKSLKVIAQKEVESNPELYKLVDFLNKNLKDKNVIFGLALKENKMTVTIYNT